MTLGGAQLSLVTLPCLQRILYVCEIMNFGTWLCCQLNFDFFSLSLSCILTKAELAGS